MRISDWSSDVCSSDLLDGQPRRAPLPESRISLSFIQLVTPDKRAPRYLIGGSAIRGLWQVRPPSVATCCGGLWLSRLGVWLIGGDRRSVVSGKRVPVRVDLGGRGSVKKKNNSKTEKL